jgi:co-chaperonin GroES (HSP10)
MIRPLKDNVIIALEPKPTQTASGIQLVHDMKKVKARESRTAIVLASGPGYYRPRPALLGARVYHEAGSAFVPNETRAGDRVIVDALAGQNYDFDLSIPRTNVSPEFQELVGERGEFRIVREQEILGIIETESAAAE